MHPNASAFRAAARRSLKGYWGWALLVCLVAALLGGVSGGSGGVSGFFRSAQDHAADYPGMERLAAAAAPYACVWGIAVFLIGGAVELGACSFHCRLNLGQRPPFDALFERFSIFGKALGLRLFCALFILLWSLLLVVPGIIAAYRYSMAKYLMAEYPDMGVREAVNRSKELMDGNKGRLFCLQFSFIGWCLLSVLTLGILSLWLTPYVETATAAFYLELTGKQYGLPNAAA